jgi:hypothetical protein
MAEERDIPITNEMTTFLHCKRCMDELMNNDAIELSPRDYAQLEIGMTKWGFQVWCKRHECNVMHVDYEGAVHPANLDRIGPDPLKVVT